MTSLPWGLRRALFAPVTPDDLVALIAIDHPAWDAPIRLCDKVVERFSVEPLREGVRHLGDIYDYGVISAMLPDDDAAALPSIPVVLENVAQDLRLLLDEAIEECTVTLKYVRKLSPDEIAQSFEEFRLGEVAAQDNTLALSLTLDPDEAEPFPYLLFTPDTAPGLFR